jgi:hypothetical protein
MTVTLTWEDPAQTIIRCAFSGAFDVENYAALEGDLPLMIASVSHRVDVIVCLLPGASLPSLRGLLPEIGILINIMPPNFGLLVGVGHGLLLTNPLSINIANWLIVLYYPQARDRLFVAGSYDAARRLIVRQREAATRS